MSGSVLLDTNIVIAAFRQERRLTRRLAECPRLFLPSIVLGELYYGAFNSARLQENLARIENLAPESTVLVCDKQTAEHYGRIRKSLRHKGTPLPDNDVWIAATAQQHGLTLISRDQHFREIEGLSLEAW
ncbi:MAG: type II toxin-antitoxin system VapC family toxin [Terriglobales bacterium]